MARDDDNPDLFSAYDFENRNLPLLPVFIESVDGIPAEKVRAELSYVIVFRVMQKLYADTDWFLNMQKLAKSAPMISDGINRILESGEFSPLPVTEGELIDRMKSMPDIMERLRELGDDAPPWAIESHKIKK